MSRILVPGLRKPELRAGTKRCQANGRWTAAFWNTARQKLNKFKHFGCIIPADIVNGEIVSMRECEKQLKHAAQQEQDEAGTSSGERASKRRRL